MSAEQLDGEFALAQPAVDILPAAGSRKGKQPEPVAAFAPPVGEPAPPAVSEPAAQEPAHELANGSVNPWSGVAAVTVEPVAQDGPGHAERAPKKFFGMQVRRPKKTAEPVAEQDSAQDSGHDSAHDSAPGSEYEAFLSPVAAWPTDVGMTAVAEAEPWGGLASASPPQEAAEPVAPAPPPALQAPEASDAPPAPPAPVSPAPPADTSAGEIQALRALLEASEAQRLAAETRADQAVTYAQQSQARLQQLEADGQARIQAAEANARTAANEAQDWQIRHREAEATIAELVASVAGAEQRMAELRTERDELLASLEDATAPAADAPKAAEAAQAPAATS